MSVAYYNENDPYAAKWLENLIAAGHIARGVVDQRSISDVTPNDLRGFTQCHFFAGIGVWSHALRRAGWPDEMPIWTGSCPCQPFSAAGKGVGVDDERHLWPHWHHLIRECRPAVVLGEQVASKDGLGWFDLVSSDLEAEGYAAAAADLCAAGFSGAHIRQRLYFVGLADAAGSGQSWQGGQSGSQEQRIAELRGTDQSRTTHAPMLGRHAVDWLYCRDGKWRAVEPGTFPLVNETPARVGRLRAYGNGLDAETATRFIEAVMAL